MGVHRLTAPPTGQNLFDGVVGRAMVEFRFGGTLTSVAVTRNVKRTADRYTTVAVTRNNAATVKVCTPAKLSGAQTGARERKVCESRRTRRSPVRGRPRLSNRGHCFIRFFIYFVFFVVVVIFFFFCFLVRARPATATNRPVFPRAYDTRRIS